MNQAENIEHLLMTCLKWNKGKDATDKGDHEGLGKDQPVEIAYCRMDYDSRRGQRKTRISYAMVARGIKLESG